MTNFVVLCTHQGKRIVRYKTKAPVLEPCWTAGYRSGPVHLVPQLSRTAWGPGGRPAARVGGGLARGAGGKRVMFTSGFCHLWWGSSA